MSQGILRSFREHHIDPTAITRHDFIETNGNNFAVTMPALGIMAYQMLTRSSGEIAASYNSYMFLFLLGILISMTNQVRTSNSLGPVWAASVMYGGSKFPGIWLLRQLLFDWINEILLLLHL